MTSTWNLQGSYAWLETPDALEPDERLQRWTASATHSMTDGPRAWTTTAARGRNVPEHARATDSALVETAVDLDGLGVTFARAEYVVKTGHDFALPDATPRSGSRSARSRSATSTGGS